MEGDKIMHPDGREGVVTAQVETHGGPLAAMLEVAVAPTPLTNDELII